MAIRVLSGLILPKKGFRDSGAATIDFSRHGVSGNTDRPTSKDIQEIGPDKPFKFEPCKVVSLRKIKLSPHDSNRSSGWDINDKFDASSKNSLEVEWKAYGGAGILEISYLIIGEV